MTELEKFNNHMGIVGRQAKCFKSNSVADFEDYVQVGAISLLKAVRKVDLTKGKLTTYSWPIIYRDIKRYSNKFSKNPITDLPVKNKHTLGLFYDKENFWELIPENLTDQEETYLKMKLDGYNNKEIAKKIGVKFTELELILNSIIIKVREANKDQ